MTPGLVIAALVVVAFLIPARLDPAIRWKERSERERLKRLQQSDSGRG